MTGLEPVLMYILQAAVPVVLAWALRSLPKWIGAEVEKKDEERLERLAVKLCRVAEERGALDGWSSGDKKAFVLDALTDAYPDIDEALLELTIDAALKLASLGASAKTKP